jgi:glycosyltransferase involved in cell wall biosynthesis
MTAPPVSVCIPAHNGEVHICRTIESILQQTFGDFELVITDDGSTDGTWDLAKSHRDPRLRVIRNEHQRGLAGNWRFAVESCHGSLVKLVCQDDLLYPDCLARQVPILKQDSEQRIALVCGLRDIIDGVGRRIVGSRGWGKRDEQVPAAAVIHRIVRTGRNLLGEPLTGLFRKETYERCGGYRGDLPYCIDIDLWCRLLQFGDLYAIGRSIGAFRAWNESLSFSLRSDQVRQGIVFFTSLKDIGITPIARWELQLGALRCRMDALLRQALYAWLRVRGGGGSR